MVTVVPLNTLDFHDQSCWYSSVERKSPYWSYILYLKDSQGTSALHEYLNWLIHYANRFTGSRSASAADLHELKPMSLWGVLRVFTHILLTSFSQKQTMCRTPDYCKHTVQPQRDENIWEQMKTPSSFTPSCRDNPSSVKHKGDSVSVHWEWRMTVILQQKKEICSELDELFKRLPI